jgi:hypothetical protein
MVFVLLLQIILMERNPVSAQKNSSPAKSSPVLRCETTDGHIVCAAGATCSQIPGHPDLFVGRFCQPGHLICLSLIKQTIQPSGPTARQFGQTPQLRDQIFR